jgi:hypothetical protein
MQEEEDNTKCQEEEDDVLEHSILFSDPLLITKFIEKNAPKNRTNEVSSMFTCILYPWTFPLFFLYNILELKH